MNGIFGLFNLDGAPVERAALEAMGQALSFWSPSGPVLWRSGSVGLGCLPLASVPEAQGEQMPLVNAEQGLVLAAGARLDNRRELFDQLRLEAGVALSDSQLILSAYLRWGEDCTQRLDGDWYFVIWDERKQRLFLGRDHLGNTGLYYYKDRRCFAFSSSKKALLALDAVPRRPNLLRVSEVLAAWPGDGIQTGYEKILRLPPAHQLTATTAGVRLAQHWFPERIAGLRLGSDDEYVEAFLDAFRRAVQVRLRSLGRDEIGVTLSGGLDSGAVAGVAASLLQASGESLAALTAAPRADPGGFAGPERFGDETHLAQETARQWGLRHVLVSAEQVTPLAGIEHMLRVHDEPGHAAANQYWLAALLDAARQQGLRVLLTGQMGNATISWKGSGGDLLCMLLGGRLADFWRSFEKKRACAGLGRGHALRRFLLKPLLLPLLEPIQRSWHFQRRAWQAYAAIRPEFARSMRLNEHMAAEARRLAFPPGDPLQQRLAILMPGRSTLGASWLEKGAAYGLEVRDPTQDRRLIELCLAIPDAQYQQDGMDRWLIRRAMRDILPDAVRLNTRRGLQAADLGLRVLASRDEIETALDKLARHELASQVLDLPRMRAVLASLESGLNQQNFADCSAILLRGLMTGIFLLRFSDG